MVAKMGFYLSRIVSDPMLLHTELIVLNCDCHLSHKCVNSICAFLLVGLKRPILYGDVNTRPEPFRVCKNGLVTH